eukprot:1540166-Heterocapsa_arctica.AAC.1
MAHFAHHLGGPHPRTLNFVSFVSRRSRIIHRSSTSCHRVSECELSQHGHALASCGSSRSVLPCTTGATWSSASSG